MTFIRRIKQKYGTYLVKVKNYREGGKVKQKVIKYLGVETSEGKAAKRVRTDDISIRNVKRSLDILLIDKMAEELGIKSIENKHLLLLLYSHLLDRCSINKIKEWSEHTEVSDVLELQEFTVKKVYESLNELPIEEFNNINHKMNEVFSKLKADNNDAVIDVTDIYFEGNSLNIKRRRGKDGKVKKLMQIGLKVSFAEGFPEQIKQYHGNLANVNIFADMSLSDKTSGSTSIIDRGMLSLTNIKLCDSQEIKLIAGIRKNAQLNKEYLSKIKREEIFSLKNMIQLKNTKVYAMAFDFLKGKLIVIYSPNIELMKKEINFENGIDSTKNYVGYSLIYSSTNYSIKDAVTKYYDKEIVERAFKHMKGIINT